VPNGCDMVVEVVFWFVAMGCFGTAGGGTGPMKAPPDGDGTRDKLDVPSKAGGVLLVVMAGRRFEVMRKRG